jgi:TP901 family phage tail tape measure protein
VALNQAVISIFKAKDEQSKAFNRMGKSADKFGERGSKAFKKLNRSAMSTGKIMKGILAAGVVQKALGGVSAGITSVTTDFLNFDQAVTAASAKFKGLDLATEKGIKKLEALKKTARTVGAETEFNAAQAASGLDFLALAGFNAEQAMKLLPGVTNLATVANVDLATATDIASDSLGAFGLMTKDSVQLARNFTRVQDVMAKTTATSNTNLIDMFEAVKKGAPDFTAAGQSIETFSTLIGTMANSGIKGAEAGTKLRNIAVRLTGGSNAAAIAIEDLGIKVADSSGNYRDMLDIIDDVIKGTSKLGEVKKAETLKTIFGARQTGGLNVILKEGTKRLRSYRQMLIDSKGASEKMATVMRSSLINRLKSLGSALTEVGFQFFSAFDEQGASAINKLTQFVRKIDLTPLISGIKTLFGFGKKLFDKFVEIGQRTGLFDNIQKSAEKLQPVFWAIKDIIKSVWGFLERTGILDLVARQFGVLAKAVGVLADAFVIMWKVVKPILRAMETLIKPIVKLINALLTGIEKAIDLFSTQLNKPGQFAAENIGMSGFRRQERGEIAAPITREERLSRIAAAQARPITPKINIAEQIKPAKSKVDAVTQAKPARPVARQQVSTAPQGRLAATLNIKGAPEGSTVEQDSDLMKISMSEMAPAPPALSPRMG